MEEPIPELGDVRQICNILEPDALIPLIAHTEYWRNAV